MFELVSIHTLGLVFDWFSNLRNSHPRGWPYFNWSEKSTADEVTHPIRHQGQRKTGTEGLGKSNEIAE
jgi:hypothetical protein